MTIQAVRQCITRAAAPQPQQPICGTCGHPLLCADTCVALSATSHYSSVYLKAIVSPLGYVYPISRRNVTRVIQRGRTQRAFQYIMHGKLAMCTTSRIHEEGYAF